MARFPASACRGGASANLPCCWVTTARLARNAEERFVYASSKSLTAGTRSAVQIVSTVFKVGLPTPRSTRLM